LASQRRKAIPATTATLADETIDIDRNSLWYVVNINPGRLCVKANAGAKYGRGFRGGPEKRGHLFSLHPQKEEK
jgi:hypothetical protein